ncbi:MAG: alkaline phosphatase D family protein [Gammaproteobacteria bacterium]|nr:alkaline phosphatase D family protein [Gammaproteobacteria bacterium]
MRLGRLTRRQVVLALLANSALAAACGAPQGGRGVPVTFRHGVASGDPGVDSIVLWTRVTPSQPAVIEVEWELARDAEFTEVLAAGRTATAQEIDYTVKTVVEGLAPGQSYFYRFRSGDARSPVGRTRTLPGVGVERVALAVISCSHFSFGFYNVYRDIAQRDDLDAVVHLGDYIYESSADETGSGYGGEQGRRLGREHDPTHEAATLADYRARYAQYRSDPDLQAAHARLPFITVWDDHESANDCWMEGAEAHDPLTQGPWDVRRDASLQAYYEWLPLREPEDGRPLYEIDRRYDFGDIASLYMVDTRLTGRTRQFSYSRDLVYIHTPFDFSDPDAPRAIVDAQDLALIPAESVRHVKTPFDTRGETREPVLDYARIQQFEAEGLPPGFEYWPDTQRTREEVLADDARAILSSEQEAWLAQGIDASVEAGIAWQVLGSAVVMASMPAPDYTQVFPPELIADALADNPYTQHWLDRTRYGLPISMDAWDGYPKARERVYDMVRDSNADFIVVSGDSHNFWMNKLHDQRDGRIVATEFATTSVTSMGGYEWFGDDPRIFELAEQTMTRECEDVEFFDARHRGYLMLEMTRSQARAHYIGMDTIVTREYTAKTLASFTLDKATGGARAPAA